MATALFATASPRTANIHRLRNNIAVAAAVAAPTADAASNGDDVPLASPGDMQLYNFYKPSLVAGQYSIKTAQTVNYTAGDGTAVQQTLHAPVSQIFDVVAPQFMIDPNEIHSTYPPAGHADQPMILPHVVFNDAHLPWERLSSVTYTHDKTDACILPWMALLPFDPHGPPDSAGVQELLLSATQLNGSTAVYKDPQSTTALTQSPTFSITMTVAEYLQLPANVPSGGTPVHIPNYAVSDPRNTDYNNIKALDTPVDVIFISGALFRGLFVSKADPTKIDLDHYKYCSHVRNINTSGMVQAGVEDTGIFSIIHSRRSGPTDIVQNTAPRPQAVHLVSLEFIADMTSIPGDTDLVALVSLYSWSYLCQPPLSVNFIDCMRDIGLQVKDATQSNLLLYTEAFINSTAQKTQLQGRTDLQNTLAKRMRDGYTLVRHRVATGEQTVAYFRGALTPNQNANNAYTNWPVSSNNGQDYLILDPKQGIMDVTYSTAWQLGKTLAISDFAFSSALGRFRRLLHSQGVKAAAFTRVAMVKNISTKAETLSSLNNTLASVRKASAIPPPSSAVRSAPPHAPVSMPARFSGPQSDVHPEIKRAFFEGIASAAKVQTSALGGGSQAFEEVTTKPANNDWAVILSWIMDRIWLRSIPGHYLVPEATFLPPESIRFFHIDRVWIDCLVDGALSVANHLARETDPVRQEIKRRINEYLGTVIGEDTLAHHPQVPTFGFFLRSAAVAAFPDMRIEVPYTTDKTKNDAAQGGKLPILVRKQFAKDITMCLLDRLPTGGQIASIKIAQPVHQQCFSVGDFLDATHVEFLFRKVYRSMSDTDATSQFLHEMGDPQTWNTGSTPSIYDWTSRCVQMDVLDSTLFGKDAPNGLPQQLPDEWGPSKGTFALDSSMTGLQLNDTVVYLEMPRPNGVTESVPPPALTADSIPYTLWMGDSTQAQAAAAIADRANVPPGPLTGASGATTSVSSQQPRALAVSNVATGSTPSEPSLPPPSLKPVVSPPDWTRQLTVPPAPSTHSPVPPTAQFIYSIFPSTTPYVRNAPSAVYIDTPYDCDLVFSVVLPDKLAQSDLSLAMITFRIPIGAESERVITSGIAPNLHPGPGLIPDHTYTSLSARMLSNQRWVAHIDPVPPYLLIRLLPRTTNRTVPLLQNHSLSFQLNGVPLAGANGDNMVGGTVIIGVKETYVAPGPSGGVKDGTLQGTPGASILVGRKTGFHG